jgi:uncharacterized protein YkwD
MRLTWPQLGSLLLLVAVVTGSLALAYAPDATGAGPETTPTPTATPEPSGPEWTDERLAALERELATDLNEWRSARSLSTLDRSERLDEVATGHAEFLASEQRGGHTGRDNTTAPDRVGECYSGEVVAHGLSRGENPGAVSSEVIRGFEDSPPHRDILLNSHETMGVAVEVGDDGRLYVVIDFC